MRKVLLLLLLVVAMVTWGCGSSSKGSTEAPQIPSTTKSDSVVADVYLDGTTSMYGYVNYGGGTIYTEAVQAIERSVRETWKSEKVNYVKFGDSFVSLSRDQYLQMDKVGFYDQTDTSLQKVIAQSNPTHLTIVVTDLFQTNQDLDSMAIALKGKLVKEDFTLAIVGVRSQFNGKIFDVGKNGASFTYASNAPNTYRPVYFLVMGPENDVKAFSKTYEKSLAQYSPRVAVFAKNIGDMATLTSELLPSEIAKEEGVKGKLPEITTIVSDDKFLQYRLNLADTKSGALIHVASNNVVGAVPASYKPVIESLSYGVVESSEKGGNMISRLLKKITGGSDKATVTFTDISSEGVFRGIVNDFAVKDNKATMDLAFVVNAETFKGKPGIYRVNMMLQPDRDEYIKAMNVFNEWNFTDGQISGEPAQGATLGNKTLNISPLISLLAGMTYEIKHPGFNNNYIFLEAVK